MLRLLVAFFFLFSFGLAPAFADCCNDDDDTQVVATSEAHSHDSSDHSDDSSKAAHHCGICHVHASDRMPASVAISISFTSGALIPVAYSRLPAAFKPSPLLEPPSHA